MFNFKVKRVEFDAYGEVLDQNTLDRYTQKFTTVGANEMDVNGGDTNNNNTTTTNNKTTADGSDKNNNNNSNNSKNNKDNNEMDEDDSDEDKEDEDLEDAIPTIMRKEIIKGGITIKCQIKYAPLSPTKQITLLTKVNSLSVWFLN